MLENATKTTDSAVDAKARDVRGPEVTRRARRRIWLAWLWVALWAAVIWQLGTDAYSLRRTSGFMQWVIESLFGEVDAATRYKLYMLFRKSAHFTEYAILALLSFRAALLSAARARIVTACWIALFLVGTVAAADEFRQAFSSSRTGSPYDVLIDLTGGLVALTGLLFISRRVRFSKQAAGTL
jgi:VanZ family protein